MRTFRGVADRFERAAAANLRVIAVLAIAMAAPFNLQAARVHIHLDIGHLAAGEEDLSRLGLSGFAIGLPGPGRSLRT